jgi:hypothetical protein
VPTVTDLFRGVVWPLRAIWHNTDFIHRTHVRPAGRDRPMFTGVAQPTPRAYRAARSAASSQIPVSTMRQPVGRPPAARRRHRYARTVHRWIGPGSSRAKEVPASDKTKSKPAHKIRAGSVKLAIPKNDGDASSRIVRPPDTILSDGPAESTGRRTARPACKRSTSLRQSVLPLEMDRRTGGRARGNRRPDEPVGLDLRLSPSFRPSGLTFRASREDPR